MYYKFDSRPHQCITAPSLGVARAYFFREIVRCGFPQVLDAH
jgi:hypothetical protein